MLASSFEFFVRNDTGQEIPINGVTINLQKWKFDANGDLSYRTPTVLQNASAIANATSGTVGGPQNNAAELDLGAHLDIQFNALAGATQTAQLYLRLLGADQNTMGLVSVTDITTQKIFGAEI